MNWLKGAHPARHRSAVTSPIEACRDRAPLPIALEWILVERVVECRPPRPQARCSAQFLAPAHVGELLVAEVMLDDSAEGVMLHEATLSCGEQIVGRSECLRGRIRR